MKSPFTGNSLLQNRIGKSVLITSPENITSQFCGYLLSFQRSSVCRFHIGLLLMEHPWTSKHLDFISTLFGMPFIYSLLQHEQ